MHGSLKEINKKNVCLDLFLLLCDYISRVRKLFTVFGSIEKVPFIILYSSQYLFCLHDFFFLCYSPRSILLL